jgi:hypothetical protein
MALARAVMGTSLGVGVFVLAIFLYAQTAQAWFGGRPPEGRLGLVISGGVVTALFPAAFVAARASRGQLFPPLFLAFTVTGLAALRFGQSLTSLGLVALAAAALTAAVAGWRVGLWRLKRPAED